MIDICMQDLMYSVMSNNKSSFANKNDTDQNVNSNYKKLQKSLSSVNVKPVAMQDVLWNETFLESDSSH